MASVMPLSRKYGALVGFLFASVSMVLYDILTGYVGLWTWTTALAYGIIGLFSELYFKKFKASPINFATFAFIGTIFFDVVTGILFAPAFGQSIWNATILQIPFTAIHLAGNVGFALTISPMLDKWFASEKLFAIKKEMDISSASSGIKI